ncbi:MAG TPA: kelch repeat-containing protein [Myxococcales bacterium]
MKRSELVAAAFVSVLATGCDPVSFVASRSCQAQADCPAGSSCVEHRCRQCPPCAADQRCLLGQCLPASCGAEACLADEACLDGRCLGPSCVGVECPDGRCVGGVCWPTACGGEPCPAGWACDGARCREAACLGRDCGPASHCVAGACLSCAVAEDCANAVDDDCDGQTDCADSDCEGRACGVEAGCAALACRAGACLEVPSSPGTTCRPAADRCDRPEACDGLTTACPPDAVELAGVECRPAAGACDVAESCDGTGVACPADGFLPAAAPCRAAAGACDLEEGCSGASAECPPDGKRAAGSVCRGSAGACDPEEACDGAADDCPPDAVAAAEVICRPAVGACDAAERCDGVGAACPADDLLPASTPCRPAAGPCDLEEDCAGTSPECPADQRRPAGSGCRSSAGACDVAETCDGSASECPADGKRSAGASCRASLGPCDPEETCDGASAACPPDRLLSTGDPCAASTGPCELAAYCDGNSPQCPARALLAGTVCRNAVDLCDVAESCSGAVASCPADGVEPGGTACGASSACDGVSTACPGANLPTAPVFVSITPASPSRTSTTPAVKGLSSADTATVTLYSDAACGASLGSGSKAAFEASGLTATVAANSATTIHAVAFNAGAQGSPCTFLTTYVHDSLGPADPVFVTTRPAPPAGTSFAVVGLASADSVSVSISTDAACGAQVGTGSRAAFAGSGVPVVLPANVDTTLYGQAVDAAGNPSACVPLTSYQAVKSWTWVAGGGLANSLAVYGTQGVAASGNAPGARDQTMMWASLGALWVFGGNACSTAQCANEIFNDLWRFDGANWAWVKGSSTSGVEGVYGTLGAASPANTPGARQRFGGTQDAAGNLWVFGGYGWGLAKTGKPGLMNDLWRFDGTNWTWISGSTCTSMQCVPGRPGSPTAVYGTRGIAASGNVPGGRSDASLWFDAAGTLWLFGGAGCDTSKCVNNFNLLNDLWKFEPGTGLWTWVAGANVANSAASYGTEGQGAPGNVPGPRIYQVAWISSGQALVFGGNGTDAAGVAGDLSDLWRFDGTNWAWQAGPSAVGRLATPGAQGAAAPTNWPGARSLTGLGARGPGPVWVYGGTGCDSATCDSAANYLGDLWRWDGAAWTWMTGSSLANERAAHGTVGVPATSNTPGGRNRFGGALDASGAYWIFGGLGYDDAGTLGRMNDLWRYQ